jgi:hypothetical protein
MPPNIFYAPQGPCYSWKLGKGTQPPDIMAQRLTVDSKQTLLNVRDRVKETVEQQLLPHVSECKRQTPHANKLESVLRACLFNIHTFLKDEPMFHTLYSAAKMFIPESGPPVFTATLSETPSHRLTLVGIHQLITIPKHDHPEVASVQLILSGSLRIRHYELVERCKTEDRLVCLERISNQEYSQGDFDVITPLAGNIHDLAATTSTAVLLSLQAPPCQNDQQSWFFPLEIPRTDHSTLLCRRMKNHALQRLHTSELQVDKPT